jgi:hypothetical protein
MTDKESMPKTRAWALLMGMIVVATTPLAACGVIIGGGLANRPLVSDPAVWATVLVLVAATLYAIVVIVRWRYLPRSMF